MAVLDPIPRPTAPDTPWVARLCGPFPQPVPLGPGRTVFGRADWLPLHHPDATVIILPSFAVAKTHAAVTATADGYVLEDLRSRNGTRVNGRPVTGPVLLRDGDEVAFPDFAFVFRA